MRYVLPLILMSVAAPATAADDPNLLSLEELLDSYAANQPARPEADVQLEGWVEKRPGGGGEVVIVLDPDGETKLNADPGITVTPSAAGEVEWQVALPYRHVDQTIDYFEPTATIRMAFEGDAAGPIVVLVEYAYCVVEFQCFFGEEELTLAALD